MALASSKSSGMFLIRYLHPFTFLVALTVGIIIVFLLAPRKTVVFRFPSPQNTDTVYTTDSGECYRYRANKVDCSDSPESEVVDQPTKN